MKKITLNKYKKFNIVLFVLFFSMFIIYKMLCFVYYKDFINSLWIEKIYQKKQVYAKTITQPKLIIIGGSNVLFSIKAESLEKEFKISVLNLGTNAGLGLSYMLYRIQKDFIKPGDTVLLSIEYELYNHKNRNGNVRDNYILSFDRNYFNNIPIEEKINATNSISFKNLLKSFIQQCDAKKNGIKELADKIYDSKNINKNGDQLMNNGIDDVKLNKTDKLKDVLKNSLDLKKLPNKDLILFLDWCKQNNVKVIYTFPTTIFHKEYNRDDYKILQNDLKEFYKSKNIPILNTDNILYLDRKYFFDSEYHLNYKGRDIRTKILLNELKSII